MNDAELCALFRRGWSTNRIAHRIGDTAWNVWSRLKENGVEIRPRSLRSRTAIVDSHGYVRWGSTRVHPIICRAWHGPPPTPDHEVNHKDGDKTNNHPENLEWVTHSENMQHAYEMGLCPPPPTHTGESHPLAKLTAESVEEARQLWRDGWSMSQLGERYGVSRHTAWRAATGRTWKHVPMPEEHAREIEERNDLPPEGGAA